MEPNRNNLPAEVAVELGFLAQAQVDACVEDRERLAAMGFHRSLLQIFADKGLLSPEQVAQVKSGMGRRGTRPRLGKYELVRKVGQGAMGTVFEARQTALGRRVAVKILPPALGRDPQAVARFRREAKLAADIVHPNAVAIYDVGEESGLHYIAMEYVEGRSLAAEVAESGPLTERAALTILRGIASALQAAHERGIVHRDVKPSNILLAAGGAKLSDLGLAFQTTGGDTPDPGRAVGTPAYMSPEQCQGQPGVDKRTDIYSLGAAMFHAACGRPPFEGADKDALMRQHVFEPLPDPRTFNPGLSEGFGELLAGMMAKERALRYQDCAEVVKAADAVLSGQTPPPPRAAAEADDGAGARLSRPAGRKEPGTFSWGAGAFLLVLLLAAALSAHRATRYVQSRLATRAAREWTEAQEDRFRRVREAAAEGDRLTDAERYAEAKAAYEQALAGAEALTGDIEGQKAEVRHERARDVHRHFLASAGALAESVRRQLAAPEIVHGAEGRVLWEGQWVTPEQKQEILSRREPVEPEPVPPEPDDPPDPEPPPVEPPAPPEPEEPPKPEPAPPVFDLDAAIWTLDDFAAEEAGDWRVEDRSRPATVEPVVHDEARRLAIRIEEGEGEAAVLGRAAALDLSSRVQLVLEAENAGPTEAKVAIGIEAEAYFESLPVILRPGKPETLRFSLKARSFKSAESQWQYVVPLGDLTHVRRICLVVEAPPNTTVFLDKVALHKDAQ